MKLHAIAVVVFVIVPRLSSAAPPPIAEFWGATTEEARLDVLRTTCDPKGQSNPLPIRQRTAEEQKQLEQKLEWFYNGRYAVMVHYLSGIAASARIQWTREEWDEMRSV